MMDRTGAEWVRKTFKVDMSPLGENVANLLDKVFCGIYHLDASKLKKINWSDTHFVAVQLHWQSLSTYDNDNLTRLVVLAHDHCLRVDISARTVKTIEIMFHQRKPGGSLMDRMPTMEQHLADIRRYHPAREESEEPTP
jgi:hypothetical protein